MASTADLMGDDLSPLTIKKPQGSVRRFMRIAGGYWKSDQKCAHSDDCDHSFRSIATTCSDRSRPVWRGCS